MWFLEGAFWVILILGAAALGAVGYFAYAMVGAARRLPGVRRLPRVGVRPEAETRALTDDDLFSCPRRLGELEARLAERHAAVQAQAEVLAARRASLAGKAARDDLTRNYDQDVNLLTRRSASMRRVLAQVWKTRTILVLRAQLAATARRRPDLGRLPDPAAAGVHLKAASVRFLEAAEQVRRYLDQVDTDSHGLAQAAPPRPEVADVDAAIVAAVEAEQASTRRAYAELREDIDRLADNLTWLGDHCAARAIADTAPEPMDQMGGAARLLEEVEAALVAVSQLSRSVDPTLAATALANLDEEISGLEKAGMEAQAETDAVLEVDRLLRQASG